MESLEKRIAERKQRAKGPDQVDDGRYTTIVAPEPVQEQEKKWAKVNNIDPKDLSKAKGPVDPTA